MAYGLHQLLLATVCGLSLASSPCLGSDGWTGTSQGRQPPMILAASGLEVGRQN